MYCKLNQILTLSTITATFAFGAVSSAQSRPAGAIPYTAFSPAVASNKPPGGGWNNADPQTVNPGEEVWIAFENIGPDANATKTYRLELSVTQSSPGNFGQFHLKERVGFNTTTATGAIPSSNGYTFFGATKIVIAAGFPQCVQWERFKFKNSGPNPIEFNIWYVSECSCKGDGDSDNDGVPDIFQIEPGTLGVPGGMNGPTQITEFHVYPQNATVDTNVTPTFDAPQHTGNWTPEFSFIDPFGEARPNGGVRFNSDGPGLAPGEFYLMSMGYTNPAGDPLHDVFIFDQWIGDHAQLTMDVTPPLPFEESFDAYEEEESVLEKNGWKGWDNEPAFAAPISNVQSRSSANSIQIEGTADVVRELDTPEGQGTWAFSAWQYIPSDFTSGGGGQWRGSHFILLDTYNDGGPYHWAVDMQVDSVSGSMHVYHGDNTNSIQIPYDTDRWTKIQIIIDLDHDWTEVYYDDDLVTEYSWTGGILGDGGGALDIGAVDLFANGSTPIYYDDLTLVRVDQPTSLESLEIVTGTVLSGGLEELEEIDTEVLTTRSGFGRTLLDLHHTEYLVTAQTPRQISFDALQVSAATAMNQTSGIGKIGLLNRDTLRVDWLPQHSIGLQTINWTSAWITSYEPYVNVDGEVEVHVHRVVHVPFLAFTFETYDDRIELRVRQHRP